MPILPTPDVIEIAKVCEYLALQDIASRKFYNTQVVDKRLPYLLYLERKAVQFMYALNPNDEYLDATTNYLLALCGGYAQRAQLVIGTPACISPFFISQPVSQTADLGDNITFTSLAGGSSPISYQWYKNGVLIGGATSSSLQLTNVDAGDAGTYTVQATNACGAVLSNNAILSVNVSMPGYFWFGTSDPFVDLNNGIDNLVYQLTFNITDGENIIVTPIPSGAADFVFNVTKYPTSQGVKTNYFNTGIINGTIGDAVYRNIVTIGSFFYIISKTEISLEVSQPLTFS